MPKVSIWVKEEDYPIWQTIEDRPEFIHQAIQGGQTVTDVPLTVAIPDTHLTALKIKAAKQGTNVSELVRDMVARATIKEVTALQIDIEEGK